MADKWPPWGMLLEISPETSIIIEISNQSLENPVPIRQPISRNDYNFAHQARVVKPTKGRAASQIYSTCPFAPKLDSRNSVVATDLRAASKGTSSTPCTNVPLRWLFCNPERWLWKYCMPHKVQGGAACRFVGPGGKYPLIVRFKASFDVSELEKKSKVVEKLRKSPNGKDFGTSEVLRWGSSQQRAWGLQQK